MARVSSGLDPERFSTATAIERKNEDKELYSSVLYAYCAMT